MRGLILAASTNLLPVAIVAISVFGLGRGAFDSNQMPLLRELIDERFSATGYGVLKLVSTTAGGAMVYIGGALMDANVDLARVFQIAGACLVVAALLLAVIPFPRNDRTSIDRDFEVFPASRDLQPIRSTAATGK